MNRTLVAAVFAAGTLFTALPATSGIVDPDCTAGKAAKSAAAKATVGVGGRCSPAEAASDTAKNVTGVGDGDRKKPLSGDRDRKKNKDDNKGNNRDKNND
jgi:hypothetical protein